MTRIIFNEIDVITVIRVTDKAALVTLAVDEDDHWIPLSVMADADADELSIGERDFTLRVHDWFAKKEGLL